jgi:hypothetical protein
MDLCKWSKSKTHYSRELLHSGIEGARSGGEAFLQGEPFTPFLSSSLRSALKPAVVGACIAVLGSLPAYRDKSVRRTLAFGLLGGVLGMGAGVAWESRRLSASVAGAALKNISKARDEHWLASHPIDYA